MSTYSISRCRTPTPISQARGIAVNDTGSTSGDVLLRDLIIRNNHTSSAAGAFRAFAYGTHVIYFDNNLVVGNSADQGFGAGEMFGAGQVYRALRHRVDEYLAGLERRRNGLFRHADLRNRQ